MKLRYRGCGTLKFFNKKAILFIHNVYDKYQNKEECNENPFLIKFLDLMKKAGRNK